MKYPYDEVLGYVLCKCGKHLDIVNSAFVIAFENEHEWVDRQGYGMRCDKCGCDNPVTSENVYIGDYGKYKTKW